MVVLVAGERQAHALDRVGDEDDRPVVVDALEGLEEARQVVAAEIAHEARQLLVRAALDEARDGALVAEIVEEAFPPGGAALVGEGGIELVRGGVDPFAQALAAGLAERRLHERAVLEDDHVPAEGAEQRLEARVEALAHDRIEALAVVVDDPPAIAQALLPALEQRLEDVALVHLGVADEGDHAPLGPPAAPAMRADVVLDEAGEERLRDAEADRAGREVDVVAILGARGIGLRALEAAEIRELVLRLVAEEILDGVEDRARMRLDGDPVLRPQHGEIERRHDRRQRRRRGLMAADLEPVGAVAEMVGVVDGPGGEPQDLLLEFSEQRQARVAGHAFTR